MKKLNSHFFSGVAILSNAPEPKKSSSSDPSKKSKKLELENSPSAVATASTSQVKKPTIGVQKGTRPGSKKMNGASPDDAPRATTPAARHQVTLLARSICTIDNLSEF